MCVQVFHAGTAMDAHGQLVASGGRVLSITALGDSVAAAQKQAYQVRTGCVVVNRRRIQSCCERGAWRLFDGGCTSMRIWYVG